MGIKVVGLFSESDVIGNCIETITIYKNMTINTDKWKKLLLRFSLTLNILFLIGWGISYINSPTYKIGILTEDVNAGYFGSDSTFIHIPKGTTVRDISAQGIAAIGQFENERFEIVITSDKTIVDYTMPKEKLAQFGNFYSAANKK